MNTSRGKIDLKSPAPGTAQATAQLNRFANCSEVVQLTRGPKQHWFGYYDKQQVDISGRYVLGMEYDPSLNFHSPRAGDTIRIGLIDLKENNSWTELGTSSAWSWQQGCLLQWIPGSQEEIIWNDYLDGQFVCHILNVKTGQQRTLPRSIYALSPDGKYSITTDFARLQKMRPGYGYAGITSPYEQVKAPRELGIWKIDLATGKDELIVNLEEMAALPNSGEILVDYWHWFNHFLVSPDGNRFTFLHRWRKDFPGEGAAVGGFITRMFTANPDGTGKFCIDPSGDTSHFYWRDPSHILAWTKPVRHQWGFWLLEDGTANHTLCGKEDMTQNGHATYLPGHENEWILNDTYPSSTDLKQTLYLYHEPTKKRIELGRFYEPVEFFGEWRCDLHPRCSPDGQLVTFDSTHTGEGRQMFMMDIRQQLQLNSAPPTTRWTVKK